MQFLHHFFPFLFSVYLLFCNFSFRLSNIVICFFFTFLFFQIHFFSFFVATLTLSSSCVGVLSSCCCCCCEWPFCCVFALKKMMKKRVYNFSLLLLCFNNSDENLRQFFANINFIFLLAWYKASYFNCWYFKMCLGGFKWVIQEQLWLRVFYPVSLSVSSFVEFCRFNDLFCLWQYFFGENVCYSFFLFIRLSGRRRSVLSWIFEWQSSLSFFFVSLNGHQPCPAINSTL